MNQYEILDESLEFLNESKIITEKVNMFSRLNMIEFIKGFKFTKKRESKKKLVKEAYEVALYDDMPNTDRIALAKAGDKACIKVYNAWKERYDNNDESLLYHEYKGERYRLKGYDEFFKIHKKAPTGCKVVNYDGYAVLETGVNEETQYSGVGLDFESAVAKVILNDNKNLANKYYLSTEDYLGINIEFTSAK